MSVSLSKKKSMIGRMSVLIAAFVISLSGMTAVSMVTAPSAHANASGCTGPVSGLEYFRRCITVNGSGLRVNYVYTRWNAYLSKCNTRMHVTYFDSNNNVYRQHNSALKTGCRMGDRFDPSAGYPFTAKTGRVCGTVSVNGVKQSAACVSIFP